MSDLITKDFRMRAEFPAELLKGGRLWREMNHRFETGAGYYVVRGYGRLRLIPSACHFWGAPIHDVDGAVMHDILVRIHGHKDLLSSRLGLEMNELFRTGLAWQHVGPKPTIEVSNVYVWRGPSLADRRIRASIPTTNEETT
jgi:hypothetical protein